MRLVHLTGDPSGRPAKPGFEGQSMRSGLRVLVAVLCGALFSSAPGALRAQTHPIEARGFAAGKSFQSGEIDAVNLFNGGLTLTIPLGTPYPLREGFSYQLALVYNSNVWDYRVEYDEAFPGDEDGRTKALLDLGANAGAGWSLSFGRLLSSCDPDNSTYNAEDGGKWVYISPDGGEHLFYDSLHHNVGDGSGAHFYTRDGSFLRLKTAPSSLTVETPDGITHTFTRPSNSCTGIRFSKMEDRFANRMSVSYSTITGADLWTVSDNHGRSHKIYFREPNDPDDTGDPLVTGRQLAQIDFDWIGTSPSTWYFGYYERQLYRSGKDNHSATPASFPAALLRQFDGPSGLFYDIEKTVEGGDPVGGQPYDGLNGAEFTSGAIRSIRTPTGAVYSWQFGTWSIPTGNKNQRAGRNQPAVTRREIYDSYQSRTAVWTYSSAGQNPQSNVCGWGTHYDQKVTTVNHPDLTTSKHWFSTFAKDANCTASWEYGLPYDTSTTISETNLKRSTEITKGNLPLRSTWVEYARDTESTLEALEYHTNTNRRVVRQRLSYDDDSYPGTPRYDETTFDAATYDGVGHYRRSTRFGRFGNHAAEQVTRIDTTNFNPGASATWSPSTGSVWILGLFDYQTQERGTTTRQNLTFDCHVLQPAECKGRLLERRVLANGGSAGNLDIRSAYTYETNGQVASESWLYGVDPDGSARYRALHSYSSGVRRLSRFVEPGNSSNVVLTTLDLDIDPSTGLATTSRDSAGFATTYGYDTLGRVTSAKPGAGAQALGWSEFVYTFEDSTGSDGWTNGRPSVLAKTCSTVSLTSCTPIAQRKWHFNDRGMPVGELVWHPTIGTTNEWPGRGWEYDGVGRLVRAGEWGYQGSGDSTFFNTFDAFSRPTKITFPDGKIVHLSYEGNRIVTRTVSIATDLTGDEADFDTRETYNPFGELVEVADAETTTTYGYDFGGRLSWVSQKVPGGSSQIREFEYDRFGHLLRERHPEKGGVSGGGWVEYPDRDILGNVEQMRDGENASAQATYYSYDRAGRLLTVSDDGGLLKRYTYDEAAGGSYANGKVTKAEAWTRFSAPYLAEAEVEERFVYNGRGGAVSSTSQALYLDGVLLGTSSMPIVWNDFGAIQSQTYPSWDVVPSAPGRTVDYGYTRGFLTSVAGFASALSYHDNLTLESIVRTNGVTDWIGRDPDSMQRPSGIWTSGVAAGKNWSSGTFGYDGAGNIEGIGTNRYSYDGVSRLKQASIWVPDLNPSPNSFADGYEPGDACNFETRVPDPGCYDGPQTKGLETYFYDAWGNLTRRETELNGSGTALDTPTSTASNRLTSSQYDARGNMTSFPGATYDFDLLNRMTRMRSGTEDWLFAYNADGERAISIAGGGFGSVLVTLRDLGGNVLREFRNPQRVGCRGCFYSWSRDNVYRGGQLLATVEVRTEEIQAPDSLEAPLAAPEANVSLPETVRHLTLDHLGTPRLVTDEGGNRVSYHAYWPYGREASVSDQTGLRHKFTGHERDAYNSTSTADDLDYMHARFNSPLTGRFLAVDRARSWSPKVPQSWNRYSYTRGNPLRFADPSGLIVVVPSTFKAAVELGKAKSETFRRIFKLVNDNQRITVTLSLPKGGALPSGIDGRTSWDKGSKTRTITADGTTVFSGKLTSEIRVGEGREPKYIAGTIAHELQHAQERHQYEKFEDVPTARRGVGEAGKDTNENWESENAIATGVAVTREIAGTEGSGGTGSATFEEILKDLFSGFGGAASFDCLSNVACISTTLAGGDTYEGMRR